MSNLPPRYGFDPDSARGRFINRSYAQAPFRSDLPLEYVRWADLTVIKNLPELIELNQSACGCRKRVRTADLQLSSSRVMV